MILTSEEIEYLVWGLRLLIDDMNKIKAKGILTQNMIYEVEYINSLIAKISKLENYE